jgi:hypothetical protein
MKLNEAYPRRNRRKKKKTLTQETKLEKAQQNLQLCWYRQIASASTLNALAARERLSITSLLLVRKACGHISINLLLVWVTWGELKRKSAPGARKVKKKSWIESKSYQSSFLAE